MYVLFLNFLEGNNRLLISTKINKLFIYTQLVFIIIITLKELITEFMYNLVHYVLVKPKFTTQICIPWLNCLS